MKIEARINGTVCISRFLWLEHREDLCIEEEVEIEEQCDLEIAEPIAEALIGEVLEEMEKCKDIDGLTDIGPIEYRGCA